MRDNRSLLKCITGLVFVLTCIGSFAASGMMAYYLDHAPSSCSPNDTAWRSGADAAVAAWASMVGVMFLTMVSTRLTAMECKFDALRGWKGGEVV